MSVAEPAFEWALATGVDALVDALEVGRLEAVPGGFAGTLAGLPRVVYTRLYVGDGFCRHLAPTAPRLRAALELAARHRVSLTLVTAPATEPDLAHLESLLASAAASDATALDEVVANDWGVLARLAEQPGGPHPVLGRALTRSMKDPRVSGLAGPGPAAPEWLQLLARLRVGLVEVDGLPRGASPLPLALHVPFRFVTSGSLCLLGGLTLPPVRKFRPDSPCAAPCRHVHAWLRHGSVPEPVLQRGNTLFVRTGPFDATRAAAANVRRVVVDLFEARP